MIKRLSDLAGVLMDQSGRKSWKKVGVGSIGGMHDYPWDNPKWTRERYWSPTRLAEIRGSGFESDLFEIETKASQVGDEKNLESWNSKFNTASRWSEFLECEVINPRRGKEALEFYDSDVVP
jgi:hypothetical protein